MADHKEDNSFLRARILIFSIIVMEKVSSSDNFISASQWWEKSVIALSHNQLKDCYGLKWQ